MICTAAKKSADCATKATATPKSVMIRQSAACTGFFTVMTPMAPDEDQQRRGDEDEDARRTSTVARDHDLSLRSRLGIFSRASFSLPWRPRNCSGTSSGSKCLGKMLRSCFEPVASSSRTPD